MFIHIDIYICAYMYICIYAYIYICSICMYTVVRVWYYTTWFVPFMNGFLTHFFITCQLASTSA